MRKAAGCRLNLKKEKAGSLRQRLRKEEAGSKVTRLKEKAGSQRRKAAAGRLCLRQQEEAGSKTTRQKEEAGSQRRRKLAAGRTARGVTILGRTSRAAGSHLPSIIVIPIITGPGPGLRAGLWRRARLRCAVEVALLAVMSGRHIIALRAFGKMSNMILRIAGLLKKMLVADSGLGVQGTAVVPRPGGCQVLPRSTKRQCVVPTFDPHHCPPRGEPQALGVQVTMRMVPTSTHGQPGAWGSNRILGLPVGLCPKHRTGTLVVR